MLSDQSDQIEIAQILPNLTAQERLEVLAHARSFQNSRELQQIATDLDAQRRSWLKQNWHPVTLVIIRCLTWLWICDVVAMFTIMICMGWCSSKNCSTHDNWLLALEISIIIMGVGWPLTSLVSHFTSRKIPPPQSDDGITCTIVFEAYLKCATLRQSWWCSRIADNEQIV